MGIPSVFRITALGLALALPVATIPGDTVVLVAGDPAPDFDVAALDGAEYDLASTAGRPVLLVVFYAHKQSCIAVVPELNRIVDRYAGDGLLVLAMSDDSTGAQAEFAEQHEVTFAVGRTTDRVLERRFAGEGVPRAFLIDGRGLVVWAGHPDRFRVEAGHLMYGLLKGAFVLPELPGKHKQITRALKRGEFGKAYTDLAKAVGRAPSDTEGAAALVRLEAAAAAQVEAAEKALSRGRFGEAHGLLVRLADQWQGVPGTEGVAESLAALEENTEAADELKAAGHVRKALERWREGQFDSALDALHDVGTRYAETPTGAWASEVALRHR